MNLRRFYLIGDLFSCIKTYRAVSEEPRRLNSSSDFNAVVPGSNPGPLQTIANNCKFQGRLPLEMTHYHRVASDFRQRNKNLKPKNYMGKKGSDREKRRTVKGPFLQTGIRKIYYPYGICCRNKILL
jgi:hypothetical protein